MSKQLNSNPHKCFVELQSSAIGLGSKTFLSLFPSRDRFNVGTSTHEMNEEEFSFFFYDLSKGAVKTFFDVIKL